MMWRNGDILISIRTHPINNPRRFGLVGVVSDAGDDNDGFACRLFLSVLNLKIPDIFDALSRVN